MTALFIAILTGLIAYYGSLSKKVKEEKEYYTGKEKETLTTLNNLWKDRYFKAMEHYLDIGKVQEFIVVNANERSEAQRKDKEVPVEIFEVVLKDRFAGDGSKKWIEAVTNKAWRDNIFDFGNWDELSKYYNEAKKSSIQYSYDKDKTVRKPYLKERDDWMRTSIETIAKDEGLDIRKRAVKELLTKMG